MKHIALIVGLVGLTSYLYPGSILARSDRFTHSWDSTKNWKLYKLQNFNCVFRVPPDSLKYLERKALNDDSMHTFLSQATKLGTVNPVWMGCYLASYEDADGKVQKAIVSQYGGFFYCQSENTFFQISSADQSDWRNYFENSYMSIPEINRK